MSITTRVFLFSACVFAATGYIFFADSSQGFNAEVETSQRDPAGQGSKSRTFRSASGLLMKADQVVTVKMEAIDGFADEDRDSTKLKATIKVQKTLDEPITLQWILPEGATLLSGTAEETVSNLREGDSIQREIQIRGFSSEGGPRNVTLEISSVYLGAPIGYTGVFSSHPTRPDLSRGRRENKAEHSKRREKIRSQADEPQDAAVKPPKGVHL